MPRYDARGHCRASGRGSGKGFGSVPMLLDTGADVTLLPRACVTQLQISAGPSEVYQLSDAKGTGFTQDQFAKSVRVGFRTQNCEQRAWPVFLHLSWRVKNVERTRSQSLLNEVTQDLRIEVV